MKDQQLYVSALEKENYFLREEIERTKFSKDKNEYSRFISGLIPIRGKKLSSRPDDGEFQDENKNQMNERRQEEQNV